MKQRRKLEPGMRAEWEDDTGMRFFAVLLEQKEQRLRVNNSESGFSTWIHRRQITKVFVKIRRPKMPTYDEFASWWDDNCCGADFCDSAAIKAHAYAPGFRKLCQFFGVKK